MKNFHLFFLVQEGTQAMENPENWHRLELDIVIQWGSIYLTCPRLWGYEFSPQHCKTNKQTNKQKQTKWKRSLWDQSVGKGLLCDWIEFDP